MFGDELLISNEWLIDGIFMLSPEMYQIYTIHNKLQDLRHPVNLYCWGTKPMIE